MYVYDEGTHVCGAHVRFVFLQTVPSKCLSLTVFETVEIREVMETKCAVCLEALARYRCPGCDKRTCSLKCVKNHKATDGCDGLRDKTKFVAVKDFTDINLLSDYRFLEDAGRVTDSVERGMTDYRSRANFVRSRLLQQCKRRQICLLSMPQHMTRRKENRSHCQRGIEEESVLSTELQKYIHPTESEPVVRHKLRTYVEAGMDNLRVFMKVPGSASKTPRYYELDLAKTIVDNLRGKTLIEHPTFVCVLSDQSHTYTVIEDDEDNDNIAPFKDLVLVNNHHDNHQRSNNQGYRRYGNKRQGRKRRQQEGKEEPQESEAKVNRAEPSGDSACTQET